MSVNNPYQAYQKNSVSQASPGELTLMLYNGCLKFLTLAKKDIEEKNIQSKNTNLQKAQNIIRELMVTLDVNQPISSNMIALYEFMLNRLMEANLKNDINIINEVSGLVEEFRDTWKQVIQINRQKQYGTTQTVGEV